MTLARSEENKTDQTDEGAYSAPSVSGLPRQFNLSSCRQEIKTDFLTKLLNLPLQASIIIDKLVPPDFARQPAPEMSMQLILQHVTDSTWIKAVIEEKSWAAGEYRFRLIASEIGIDESPDTEYFLWYEADYNEKTAVTIDLLLSTYCRVGPEAK